MSSQRTHFHPHDRYFKEQMAIPCVARDFLRVHLPEPILQVLDLSRLTAVNVEFVTHELKCRQVDMLFKVPYAESEEHFVYIILEQETQSHDNTVVRMMQASLNIIDHHTKRANKSHESCPVIYGMVINNSPYRSTGLITLEKIYGEERCKLQDITLLSRYRVIDLVAIDDEGIIAHRTAAFVILGMQSVALKRSFSDIIEKSRLLCHNLIERGLLSREEIKPLLFSMLYYIGRCYAINQSEQSTRMIFKDIISTEPHSLLGETLMTLNELLEQDGFEKGVEKGIERGITQGLVQGVEQGKKQVAQRLINKNPAITIEQLIELTDLPEQELSTLFAAREAVPRFDR